MGTRKQWRGTGRLWFVPSVANLNAPTVAEINAGIDITPNLVPGSLDRPQTGNTTDISDASTLQNKTAAGSYGGDPTTWQCFKDFPVSGDTIFAGLAPGTVGYYIEREDGGSTAVAATGNKVRTFKGTIIARSPDNKGTDEAQTYTVQMSCETAVNDTATVA